MADEMPKLPPAAKPFPGSTTPGWNDPPTLNYNPTAPGPSGGRTRINLNKRVAFPLQGMGAATCSANASAGAAVATKPTAIVQPSQSQLPPAAAPPATIAGSSQIVGVVHPMQNLQPVARGAPPPTHTTNNVESSQASPMNHAASVSCAEDSKWYVLKVLRENAQILVVTDPQREIERRLSIMEQLWPNLSEALKQKIVQLAKAVEHKNYGEAMELCNQIVLNHSNECATWGIALRHIVLTLQPPPVDGNTVALPAMLVPETMNANENSPSGAGHTRVQHI